MSEDIKNQFIVSDEYSNNNIEAQAQRTIPFGRITKDGTIIIDNRTLSKGDQLKLCLVIRYIASNFSEEISKEVRPVDLTGVLGQRVEAIGSLLSKLASEGFAKKISRGNYSIHAYKIDSFLDYLENIRTDDDKTSKKVRRSGTKGNALTGIGKYIQLLIDDGFFNTPKLISEVVAELKKENVFRDSKVVDKTVRDSFVSMRRSLQRVNNEDGGQANWKYVIRK